MADVDDLRAAYEQAIAKINERDLEGYFAFHHDQEVLFAPDGPFAIDGKATWRQALQRLFANSESMTVTPVNPQFRVIGDTGIVWTHHIVSIKPKDGPLQTMYLRFNAAFARIDGRWKFATVHLSRIPSGN
jgi:ketosteroid isomerase-like protein